MDRCERASSHLRLWRAGAAIVTALLVSVVIAAFAATAGAGPLPTSLVLAADPTLVTLGSSTTLSAQIDVPGATLTLMSRAVGDATFTPVTSQSADGDGAATFSVQPVRTTTYLVQFAGDETSAAAEAAATVTVRPALALTASPGSVVWDGAATLSANLGLPNTVLTLSRKAAGEPDFTPLGTLTTGADGTVSRSLSRCRTTTTYRIDYAGDAAWAAATAEAVVAVRPRLTLSVTPSAVYEGWKIKFTGQVVPAHPGEQVVLERLTTEGWKALRTLTLSSSSSFTYRWTSVGRGSLTFRVTMPGDASHARGWSTRRSVLVKNPNPYGVPTSHARFIVVDKSQYKLYYHQYGRIVRVFPCVLGKPSTPTPLGRFKIYAKDAHMWGAYGPRRMRYRGLFAIHGTNEPWLLSRFPRAYSHGCTRLANTNILWLFDHCRVGTSVWNVR